MAEKAPAYRQAYPRLDIRKLQAAVIKDRFACRYEDEIGRELGQAFILDLPEGGVVIGFGLGGPYFEYKAGNIALAAEHAPDLVNRERRFFRCPGCDLRRKILYFKGSWMCATCHKLCFRSQLVGGGVREYERLCARRDHLTHALVKGRPHRMRQATFDALQSELEGLIKKLPARPRKVASAQYRYIITETWMEAKDLPNGLYHGGYYVRGNWIEKHDWFRPPPRRS